MNKYIDIVNKACNLFSLNFVATYNIRRTCTSEIKINMFMVDHVCMSESNRRGKLCFCEDALCNGATKNKPITFFKHFPRLLPFYGIIRTLMEEIQTKLIGQELMDSTIKNLSSFPNFYNMTTNVILIQVIFSSCIVTCYNCITALIQRL